MIDVEKLKFKKYIRDLLFEDLDVDAKFKDIIILSMHKNKLNYNFVYLGNKYIIKDGLFKNIASDLRTRNICTNIPNVIHDLQKRLDNKEINKYNHLPNITTVTEHFYITPFLELTFLGFSEFFKTDFKHLMESDIYPMSISRVNVAKHKEDIIFFDFDALVCSETIRRKYIHSREIVNDNDMIIYKGDVDDVKLFHHDMHHNLKDYDEL